MTDPSVDRDRSNKNHDNIEDAVVVDETPTDAGTANASSTSGTPPAAAPLVEPSTAATPPVTAEPVVEYEPAIVAETEPDTDATSTTESGEPRVVYLTAPTPPKVSGNRGFGVFIALAATLIFAIIFAIAVVIFNAAQSGRVDLAFVQAPTFSVPILFFLLGAIMIALIVNRAGWAAHVFGSLIVGLIVYFGTIGVLLLINGVIQSTPEQAQLLFTLALIDPRVIAGGLIAREVSLWTGALVAKRGRKVTDRNRESRATWEAELAAKSADRH
jgi:hypothetical protein